MPGIAYRVSAAVSGLGFRRPEVGEGNIDKASLPDLFFTLLRGNEGEDITDVEVCYRSEVVWQSDVPKWKPLELSLHRLCSGLLDKTLKLEVFDWNRVGTHDFLGQLRVCGRELYAMSKGAGVRPDGTITLPLERKPPAELEERKQKLVQGELTFTLEALGDWPQEAEVHLE